MAGSTIGALLAIGFYYTIGRNICEMKPSGLFFDKWITDEIVEQKISGNPYRQPRPPKEGEAQQASQVTGQNWSGSNQQTPKLTGSLNPYRQPRPPKADGTTSATLSKVNSKAQLPIGNQPQIPQATGVSTNPIGNPQQASTNLPTSVSQPAQDPAKLTDLKKLMEAEPKSEPPKVQATAPTSAPQATVVQKPPTVPAQTVPAQTVPAQTVPAQTVPAQTVPAQTVPAQTASKPVQQATEQLSNKPAVTTSSIQQPVQPENAANKQVPTITPNQSGVTFNSQQMPPNSQPILSTVVTNPSLSSVQNQQPAQTSNTQPLQQSTFNPTVQPAPQPVQTNPKPLAPVPTNIAQSAMVTPIPSSMNSQVPFSQPPLTQSAGPVSQLQNSQAFSTAAGPFPVQQQPYTSMNSQIQPQNSYLQTGYNASAQFPQQQPLPSNTFVPQQAAFASQALSGGFYQTPGTSQEAFLGKK